MQLMIWKIFVKVLVSPKTPTNIVYYKRPMTIYKKGIIVLYGKKEQLL